MQRQCTEMRARNRISCRESDKLQTDCKSKTQRERHSIFDVKRMTKTLQHSCARETSNSGKLPQGRARGSREATKARESCKGIRAREYSENARSSSSTRDSKSVETQTQAQSPKTTGNTNGLSSWHRRASDLPTKSDHLQASFEISSTNCDPRII